MRNVHRIAFAIGAALGSAAGAPAAPLTGMWGAGEALLALDAQGGRLQLGCTLARLAPVQPDRAGQFTVDAKVERIKVMLPEDEEAEQASLPAKVSGRISGGRIDLTLTVQGQPPRQAQLQLGQTGKPARCL